MWKAGRINRRSDWPTKSEKTRSRGQSKRIWTIKNYDTIVIISSFSSFGSRRGGGCENDGELLSPEEVIRGIWWKRRERRGKEEAVKRKENFRKRMCRLKREQFENKAGYTANTSRGRVGRGGNACFPPFRLDHHGPTNQPTDGQSLL